MNNIFITAVLRRLITGQFLFSAIILVTAAVWLHPVTAKLSAKYDKKPISIRRPLKELDMSRLPTFRSGWSQNKIILQPQDIGTSEYAYISMTKKGTLYKFQETVLFVTYYSNPQDKVPHTPDVCYRQAGATVNKLSTIDINVPELAGKYPEIKCRMVIMEQKEIGIVDIYVFFVEGKFRYTREQARWIIGKPGNQYTYFSKIEAVSYFQVSQISDESGNAIERCKTLLIEALPVLLSEYYPTAEQITSR
jgi:hypothetical protein